MKRALGSYLLVVILSMPCWAATDTFQGLTNKLDAGREQTMQIRIAEQLTNSLARLLIGQEGKRALTCSRGSGGFFFRRKLGKLTVCYALQLQDGIIVDETCVVKSGAGDVCWLTSGGNWNGCAVSRKELQYVFNAMNQNSIRVQSLSIITSRSEFAKNIKLLKSLGFDNYLVALEEYPKRCEVYLRLDNESR